MAKGVGSVRRFETTWTGAESTNGGPLGIGIGMGGSGKDHFGAKGQSLCLTAAPGGSNVDQAP